MASQRSEAQDALCAFICKLPQNHADEVYRALCDRAWAMPPKQRDFTEALRNIALLILTLHSSEE